MTVALDKLLVLGLLTAALHWLVARSTVAKPLWSRARGLFDELLRCPACSGWWLGLALGAAGLRPIVASHVVTSIAFTGMLGIILTPMFEAMLIVGLTHAAVPPAAADDIEETLDATRIYDAVMDKLCAERADLSPDEIERIGGTVKRALGLEPPQ